MSTNGGRLELIKPPKWLRAQKSIPPYHWSGNVLALKDDSVRFGSSENERLYNQEKRNRFLAVGMVSVLLSISTSSLLRNFNALWAWQLSTIIAGVSVSLQLVQIENGADASKTQRMCQRLTGGNCEKVINSKGSKLTPWLSLADISLIYFVNLWLGFCVSHLTALTNSFDEIFTIGTWSSFIFSLYSIYYQRVVVHSWCAFCLGIVATIWIQCIVSLFLYKFTLFHALPLNFVLLALLGITLISICWLLLIKPFLTHLLETERNTFQLLRFKARDDVFRALLSQQRQISNVHFGSDIHLGNEHAKYQFTLIYNPYCQPCANTNLRLSHLLNITQLDIQIIIRFIYDAETQGDKYNATVEYLVQYLASQPRSNSGVLSAGKTLDFLNSWFSTMDLGPFKSRHPIYGSFAARHELLKSARWINENVYHTPSYFLNGYEVPSYYKLEDILTTLNRDELNTQRESA